MSSETVPKEIQNAPPVWLQALKIMRIPLFLGLVGVATALAAWWYGVPVRSLAIVVMVGCAAAIFGIPYVFLWVFLMNRHGKTPVLETDEEQKTIACYYFGPKDFAGYEIEGGELATRDSLAGKVYLAEEVKQPEETEETGTIVSTWEAGLNPWEWVEKKEMLMEWRKEAVPKVKEGVQRIAGADAKALKNSDRLAVELLVGQEKDEAFAQVEESDFGWETGVVDDEDDRGRTKPDEEDEDEDALEPGSAEMQKMEENEAAVADGGQEDA